MAAVTVIKKKRNDLTLELKYEVRTAERETKIASESLLNCFGGEKLK